MRPSVSNPQIYSQIEKQLIWRPEYGIIYVFGGIKLADFISKKKDEMDMN